MAERFDTRFTAFGVIFPWAVAFCFAAIALMLRSGVPETLGLSWPGGASVIVTFPAFVVLHAAVIGVFGSLCGVLAGARWPRRWVRRVLMGAAVGVSLIGATIGAAWLIGHQGVNSPHEGRFDPVVFALGAGAALALGVIMIFVYQPQQRWGAVDEKALAEAMAAHEGKPTVRFWVHSRASSFVFLGMLGIFPAGLLLAVNPWFSLIPLVLALLFAGTLFARVRIDGGQVSPGRLRVFIAGFVPFVAFDLESVDEDAVEETAVRVWSQGGPGPRIHGQRYQYLCRNGAALSLTVQPASGQKAGQNRQLLLGVPEQLSASRLADYLRQRAAEQ
ncbi:hypothetical protein ODZ83_07235 [Acaricomes phytoseiuli]|uniref:hypothetical protein n=1 Tax=Acaricomes phytoseiuli TaxID=291968 RepID=UPI00039F7AB3|nr:hypothetical protein [Acaricomes phytoseiuli]MCW1249977.1 hypothetical protein [Acaricomes phytoseiuli]